MVELTIQMKMAIPMLMSVINLKALGKRFQISMRLAIKLGVSTSPVTATVANSKFKRLRSHKSRQAMLSARGIKTREDRPLQRNSQLTRVELACPARATSPTKCKQTSTITICPTKRLKSLAHNKSKSATWSNSRVTVTTSASPSHQ